MNADDDMMQNVGLKEAGELINELHEVRGKILVLDARRTELESRLAIAMGLMSAQEKEHRRHFRTPCFFRCKVVSDNQVEQGTVTNINLQGIYVETNMRVLVSERVGIELQVADQLVCVDVKAVWRQPSPPTGFGAAFRGLAAKDEDHIHKSLTELLRQRLKDLQSDS